MNQQQATYQRQRASFEAAMQRDGWTAVSDIFGGTVGWAHETDSGWIVGDRIAFEHYIVNRMTPAVDLPLPF
jgi:hypothetical protein